MRKGICLYVFLGLNSFSMAQTGYGGPPESENTRIAREHQYGGAYNPRYGGEEVVRSPVWGIMALDTLNLSRSGTFHSEISLEDAKERALKLCGVEGASCSIVASYTRDNCAAIASTPQGTTPVWSVEVRHIRKDAEKAALKSCNKKLKGMGIRDQECKLWSSAKCALPGGS